MGFEEFIELEEIVQNFVDGIYKECATRPIVKFNRAVGYDANHTHEYYVYFHEELNDIINLLWNIKERKVEIINSLRGGYKNDSNI